MRRTRPNFVVDTAGHAKAVRRSAPPSRAASLETRRELSRRRKRNDALFNEVFGEVFSDLFSSRQFTGRPS